MDKKKIVLAAVLPIILMAVLGVFAFSASLSEPIGSSSGFSYNSNVCTHVTRTNGDVEQLGCSHNLVTNAGLDAIKNKLGQGSGSTVAFDYIALCNATLGCTGTNAADTTLDNEYAAGGLSRAIGAYGDLGVGNWSIYKTFTATANGIETNQTGIFNASSGGTLLAENTFTLVTLQNADQLTVNWTIQVTNP